MNNILILEYKMDEINNFILWWNFDYVDKFLFMVVF